MWAGQARFRVLGSGFVVHASPEVPLQEVERLFEPFLDAAAKSGPSRTLHILYDEGLRRWAVLRDSCVEGVAPSWEQAAALLVAVVNREALNRCRDFAVHGGAVSLGERLILFPGESGWGKSTLTAACVRSGFGYVSDEALVIGRDLRVVSYPKPVALTYASASLLELSADPEHAETVFAPEEIGAVIDLSPGQVTDVVVFERGPGETRMETQPRGSTVSSLLAHSFNHYKAPAEAFRIATEIARSARAWTLRYEDAREAAALIRQTIR